MTDQKSPAFRLYTSDFLSGTMHMTDAEVGLYIRLLCRAWEDGSIPAIVDSETEPSVLGLLPAGPKKDRLRAWRVLVRHFIPHPSKPGRLVQKRLEHERGKQIENRARRTQAAQKGAAARWPSGSKRNATALPTYSSGTANEAPSDNERSAEAKPSDSLSFMLSLSSLETSLAGARPSADGKPSSGLVNAEVYAPGIQFAAWFGAEGARRGVIPGHEVIPILDYAQRHAKASTALVEAHPLELLVAQSIRLLERGKIDGPDRQRIVSPEILFGSWSRFDAPAGRPRLTLVADDEDLDAVTVRNRLPA